MGGGIIDFSLKNVSKVLKNRGCNEKNLENFINIVEKGGGNKCKMAYGKGNRDRRLRKMEGV